MTDGRKSRSLPTDNGPESAAPAAVSFGDERKQQRRQLDADIKHWLVTPSVRDPDLDNMVAAEQARERLLVHKFGIDQGVAGTALVSSDEEAMGVVARALIPELERLRRDEPKAAKQIMIAEITAAMLGSVIKDPDLLRLVRMLMRVDRHTPAERRPKHFYDAAKIEGLALATDRTAAVRLIGRHLGINPGTVSHWRRLPEYKEAVAWWHAMGPAALID